MCNTASSTAVKRDGERRYMMVAWLGGGGCSCMYVRGLGSVPCQPSRNSSCGPARVLVLCGDRCRQAGGSRWLSAFLRRCVVVVCGRRQRLRDAVRSSYVMLCVSCDLSVQ
eukprot:4683240-Prymnesium_polylepis.2